MDGVMKEAIREDGFRGQSPLGRTDIQHQPSQTDQATLSTSIMCSHVLLFAVTDAPVGTNADGFGLGTLCHRAKMNINCNVHVE